MFAVNSQFIPCLGCIAFFVILFGFVIFMRYLNYKEPLALAEKGLVRPQAEAKDNSGKGLLLTGMIFAAIGLGLSVSLLSLGFSPWMIVGLVPLFLGLGLVLVYVLTREPVEKGEDKELKNKPSNQEAGKTKPGRTVSAPVAFTAPCILLRSTP